MSSASRTHRMLLRLARKGASSSSTIVEASNRTSTSISATTTARQGAVEDGGGGEGRFRLTPLDCGIYSHSGSNLCVVKIDAFVVGQIFIKRTNVLFLFSFLTCLSFCIYPCTYSLDDCIFHLGSCSGERCAASVAFTHGTDAGNIEVWI